MLEEAAARGWRGVIFRYRSFIPIPLLLLGGAVIFRSPSPTPLRLDRMETAGLMVVALGALVRLWALRHIGPDSRTARALIVPDLVTTGPYAHTRNPLYVGNFLIGLGVCFFVGPLWFFALYTATFALEYVAIVSLEEELLSQHFPGYEDYRRRVPVFFPSLLPRIRHRPAKLYSVFRTKEYQTIGAVLAVILLFELLELL